MLVLYYVCIIFCFKRVDVNRAESIETENSIIIETIIIIESKKRVKKPSRLHPNIFHATSVIPGYCKTCQTSIVLCILYSILFKKDMKIEQAMIYLYNQIQQKGLYFFCPYLSSKDELKYSLLKPGPTI